MTSNIAIINPNQYQSYQRKKGKKEGRAGEKGKIRKKVVLICHKYVFRTWGFFRTMHGKTAPSC